MLARAPDGRSRANARTHLAQLEALDRLEALRSQITEFRHRTGRPPRGFGELAAAGLLDEAPPLDPAGTPFLLDPGGLPRIGPESPLAGYPRR